MFRPSKLNKNITQTPLQSILKDCSEAARVDFMVLPVLCLYEPRSAKLSLPACAPSQGVPAEVVGPDLFFADYRYACSIPPLLTLVFPVFRRFFN